MAGIPTDFAFILRSWAKLESLPILTKPGTFSITKKRALKGFPEETVVAENKRINGQRDLLKQRSSELETRLEQARETEVNIESIERFCEVVRQNLDEFTFEDKRLALEALSIKIWVDGNNLEIEGAIPIAADDIQSITSRCSG
ncbi:hypothetical protein ACFLV5_02815 [Chloroflexota bacterium]